ncbi:hypothetical protein KR084_011822 [Drosophila pseudotakahashii]|nr:hypothetical protein KR084_011822 [Drosophila pseudotakahashii]
MEDIEYLDEYKDLVMPGFKSAAPPASAAGGSRQRRISSDSSNSSSIDADIFQKLFHGKYLDDELHNEGSGSKSQDRRARRSPSPSSSSDESNDALEALFSRKSSKSKPIKRRERYESFDSVDDLGEALMRPSQRSTVPKPSTSQAGARKSHSDIPHTKSSSNSSSSNFGKKPQPASAGKTAPNRSPSAKNKNSSSTATTKSSGSVNGSSLASAKNKTVTIIKAKKTDLTPSKHEPKKDPLNLGDLYGDSDSDSSYEYESDFYGDRDSEDEDAEPVIDISTDTSRTTSVADTVTPVVSEDEGQEPQREQNVENEQNAENEQSELIGLNDLNERPENDQDSVLNRVYERLQSYLSNLSSAEAPPIYKKHTSARKPRSNEKKPSSSEQVKHANDRSAASDKEEEKERELEQEPTEACSSAKSSASKASAGRRLYDVDDNVTLETVERMSLDLAEQILEIDVERSYEFEKRSGSKTRSRSRSKIPADSESITQHGKSHVRKLTYSSERLDNSEPSGNKLRRSKSENFPKRGRPRSQKQRKSRAATTEEKTLNAREGEGEPVKKKRGRPRKYFPKEDTPKVQAIENTTESLDKEIPLSVEASDATGAIKNSTESLDKEIPLSVEASDATGEAKEKVNFEETLGQDEQKAELDKAKECAGFENATQDDINMTSSHNKTDLKSAPDCDKQLDEKEPIPTLDTSTETFDTAQDHSEISESATKTNELEDKELLSVKEENQNDLKHCNEDAIKEMTQVQSAIEDTKEMELSAELTNANVEAREVSGNVLEESDSQLAEDIKLAEEILAAEVGKGIEVNEVTVASEQGGQNPVIDIVKELEQETISEAVSIPKNPSQSEEVSAVQEEILADEQSADEKQTPDEEPTKDEPPAVTRDQDQHSVAKEETLAAQEHLQDQVPKEELLAILEVPPSIVYPTKEQNHSSPANTPKKSRELECMESSVARRALRSDKVTPQTQRESRSKLVRRTELALLLDESSRRSSPRLGRSPGDSQSSQERSPAERKVTTSKLAKENTITEKEKVVGRKSLPAETETKVAKETKTIIDNPIADISKRAEEKQSDSETEIKRSMGRPLRSKKPRRTHGAESKAVTTDSNEELPSTSKCAEEYSTSSESELKDERAKLVLPPDPPVDVEQSKTRETDAAQVEEKTSNPRKSRRTLQEKRKPDSETPSKHIEARSDENAFKTIIKGKQGETDPVNDKEEPPSGRLSRRDKAKVEAAKSLKDESPSATSHSTGRRVTSKEKLSKKDQTEKSLEPVIKQTHMENKRKSKMNQSSDEKCDSQTESDPEKLSSKARSEQDLKEPEFELDTTKAVSSDAELDAIPKDSEQSFFKISTDKKSTEKMAESETVEHLELTETDKPTSTECPTVLSDSLQDSDKSKISKVKSKNRSKGDEKEPKEIIDESENEKSSELRTDAVQSSSSASSASVEKTEELKDSQKISGLESGRIRKRRQAVPIEDPEDTLITAEPIENDNSAPSNSSQVEPEPSFRLGKTPTKTYLMNKRNKMPSSESSENIQKPVELKTTSKEQLDSENEVLDSVSDPAQASPESFATMLPSTSTENSQKDLPTTPTTSNDQTKKTFSTNKRSSKSKNRGPRGARKSDNTLEDSPSLVSESMTSTNQKELSTPKVSCRKLRILIKRTPTSNFPKVIKKTSVLKKTPAKPKRLNKIIESTEENALPEQCDNETAIPSVETNPDPDPVPVSVPKSDPVPETKPILNEEVPKETPENEGNDIENKLEDKLEKGHDQVTEDIETPAKGERPITEEPTEAVEPKDSTHVVQESNIEECNSINMAPQAEETLSEELPEEEEPNDEPPKGESQEEETPKDQILDDEVLNEESPSKGEDSEPEEVPNLVPIEDQPETDVTDDEEPAQSPIPDSTETTSVTDDPEGSTSSVVKRTLRKREADSSQPDEAARRKQRQNMEKSATERQELVKQIRRRQVLEEEERPALKRTKVEPETKPNSKSKFISIIGDTIMSSTKPQIKETRSEPAKTSQAEKKSTVRESKHVEITKHIVLPPAPRKVLNPGSPTPAVKKPLVQTLLSSTLSLQKPVDGSPLTSKKSLNKSDADENKDGDQPVLGSSIVMTKKPLYNKKIEFQKADASSAVPKKASISVSVVTSSETAAENSKTPGSTPETSPILPRKAQIEPQKMAKKSEPIKKSEANKKSEVLKKAEIKKKTTSQGTQGKPVKSEEATEPSKKTVSSAVTGRKPLPQLEAPKKTEIRKSEASSAESNPRKAPPQVNRSKKFEGRKSAGASLTATAREQIPQTDVAMKTEARKSEGSSLPATARKLVTQTDAPRKSEVRKSDDPSKAVTDEESAKTVQAEPSVTTVRGRGVVKKTKPEQRKSKNKPELPFSDVETATDSRDSSRDDKSERPVTVTSRQFILNKSVHMTRAASSNRSLAPTPTPMQRNESNERFTSVPDPKLPALGRTFKSRGRGGRKGQLAMKRKAEEAADANEVANAKRLRELPDEGLPPRQETGFLAFPVKITSSSSTVDPLADSPTTKPAQQMGKIRKVRVKINRSPFNQWLQEKKNREKQAALRKLLTPTREASETDSAAESMSESMLQPQADTAVSVPQTVSSSALAPELAVRKGSTQIGPTAAPADSPSTSVKAQKATQPAKATLKTAIYPLTETHLPDDATLTGNAKKLENQRRVIQYHAKLMPLPVPIPEVKSEPEDAPPEPMDEDPLMVPLPVVAEAPVALQPPSGIEGTIQINNLAASTSSGVSASHLIPSASAGGNPNSVGQTKMFSFLYPMRYKRSYDDVGLDFCCPNLDGPMRAIDFTRLHSTAEVPVLEMPQFLVITTKFFSKGDTNIPSKVRAKMDLMGRTKDLSDLTASGLTPAPDFPANPTLFGPATQAPSSIIQSIPPAPIEPTNPDSSSIPTPMDTSQFPPAVSSDSAPSVVSQPPSSNFDSLTKQLSRGITKRNSQPGAVMPATASSSMVANLPPTLIQLPPICPTDQLRVDLQAKVQAFDLVLQTLSRRAATLTVTERQSTIEEIVRTSSLMAIDVDVGTKLLENYVHYLNKVTSTSTPLPQSQINSVVTKSTPIAANPSNPIASTSSSLSKSTVSSTTASADTPTQGAKINVQNVQQRSSLPNSVPLYDADKNIIGFQCPPAQPRAVPPTVGRKVAPAATSTPVRASTSSTAAVAKVQLRSTQGGRKSTGGNASQVCIHFMTKKPLLLTNIVHQQIVNLNTTVSLNKPAPKVVPKKKQAALGTVMSINQPASVQRPVLCKKKTTPIRTVTQTKTIPSPAAPASTTRAPTKPRATPSTVPDAAPVLAPAGMSLSSTSNPNVFIINQVSHPEESILPDSNNAVAPMAAEIKGELDDSSEAII